jgi:hypothetical protein
MRFSATKYSLAKAVLDQQFQKYRQAGVSSPQSLSHSSILCNTGESIAASRGEFKGKGGSYAANKTGKKGRLYFLTIRDKTGQGERAEQR